MNPQNMTAQPSQLPQTETFQQTENAKNGWTNIPPRPVETAQPQQMSRKKKVLVIAGSIVVGMILIAGLLAFIADKRAEAAQAKLQRESRTVIL